MNHIDQQTFTGERALFSERDLYITDSTFADGESPLKESHNIQVENSFFKWKYPFWYSKNVRMTDCVLQDTARAGIWYSDMVTVKNTAIKAPKTFRQTKNITLHDVSMPNADETLWMCEGIALKDVTANGNYFALNSKVICANNLTLTGDYSFDGCREIKIRNSKLLSKDAFWNCENVTVENSLITGEYIGWNSKNLTFINCTIQSLQGFCYIEKLVLKNCKLLNTTLAFEYCSDIDVNVITAIDSVKNPISGVIRAREIGELILDESIINPNKTKILLGEMKDAV